MQKITDQIGVGRNLSIKEKNNVYLAIAVGCLTTINHEIPGPDHLKKKRSLHTLGDRILKTIAPKLPRVAKHNIPLFEDTIRASETVLNKISEESQYNRVHILLNLVGFCLDELPASKDIMRRYNELFNLWEDAYRYEDIKSGERIFHRIESEVQILVAQRGGIIL